MPAEIRCLGIRHHGPGSALATVRALDAFDPDLILLEAPADADPLVGFVAEEDFRPPVALISYVQDDPAVATFYPFAEFSPELQTMRWATSRGVTVTAMDLPSTLRLAQSRDESNLPGERIDPIGALASAAGYSDPESWWEDLVEHSRSGDPFDAISDAMTAVRADATVDHVDAVREAHMRKVLRAALKSDAERIAVVCGAWHVPALMAPLPKVSEDNALLKGLPKVKTAMTWVPWSNARLASGTGYRAGITAPGWYAHLFATPDNTIASWFTRVAQELRKHGFPASSAQVIDATRLTGALAALRSRPAPGIWEVRDAADTSLFEFSDARRKLIDDALYLGAELGSVPADVPTLPLEKDVLATAKSLRLKVEGTPKEVTLDLRSDNDRQKSALFHRLRILGIAWAVPRAESGAGSFKEGWTLAWEPDFAVNLAVASLWGTTVASAAHARLLSGLDSLATVTAALNSAVQADLSGALDDLLAELDRFAALQHDVSALLEAVPAIIGAARYGTVRGTDTAIFTGIASGMLTRIRTGLLPAVLGLGSEPAHEIGDLIDRVNDSISLTPHEVDAWRTALARIASRRDVDARLRGHLTRLLTDAGHIDDEQSRREISANLSAGVGPIDQAAWIEGYLGGGALILLNDRDLLSVLNTWLMSLSDDHFVEILPFVRRSFGGFTDTEREDVHRQVRHLAEAGGQGEDPADSLQLDGPVLPALQTIRAIYLATQKESSR
ncbi:DUF5682 family protein [Corynebacterium doosanense]|uniref:Uncharacterized protein n=1 Tax=Corynebacterium doosanense CAU 212 = DSM 45436 TaxID=558173 RepID=A0A097IDU3_9CORY|nr:DUF5682 family protein [Corynebacterium doosanense]AIT60313.1 hypothetical protein CDOO_02920 [Corynebacterium doosanense CAU 212 = DSM 45436]